MDKEATGSCYIFIIKLRLALYHREMAMGFCYYKNWTSVFYTQFKTEDSFSMKHLFWASTKIAHKWIKKRPCRVIFLLISQYQLYHQDIAGLGSSITKYYD